MSNQLISSRTSHLEPWEGRNILPVTTKDEAEFILNNAITWLSGLKMNLGLSGHTPLNNSEDYPLIKSYDKFAMKTYLPIGAVAGSVFVTGLVTEFSAVSLSTETILIPSLTAFIALFIPAIDSLASYKGNPKERTKYLLTRMFTSRAKKKLAEAHLLEEQRQASLKLYKMAVERTKEELHRLNVFTVLNAQLLSVGEHLKGMNNMGELATYYTLEQLEIEL